MTRHRKITCSCPSTRRRAREPDWATAIAKKIIEEHGGRIEVTSRLGDETRVILRLPSKVTRL